jgi:hypothetical protein
VAKEDKSPLQVGEVPRTTRKRKEIYTEAIHLAETRGVQPALKILKEECPVDYLQKGDQIERALMRVRARKTGSSVAPRPLSSFHPGIRQTLPKDWKTSWKNLFLWGPTNLGKTQLARALLPKATVVRHRNTLLNCDFSHGVIFDDFSVSHWPATSVIHLLDWDEPSDIDVKHNVASIPPHTTKIFTFNADPNHWMPSGIHGDVQNAILRRLHSIEVTERLYPIQR